MNEARPHTVFFIGKPGSGKGTQAKLLAAATGWKVLASGEEFRRIAGEDTPVGHKTKEEIDNGLLSPHWFAMYLFLKALFSVPSDADVIFDGFNRKEAEARLIVDALAWLERPFRVIHIVVSDEEVRRRLEERRAVQGRVDDSYVETRLEEYETFTTRAIEIFSDLGVLIPINGEQSPEKVDEDVRRALGLL